MMKSRSEFTKNRYLKINGRAPFRYLAGGRFGPGPKSQSSKTAARGIDYSEDSAPLSARRASVVRKVKVIIKTVFLRIRFNDKTFLRVRSGIVQENR